MGEVEIEKKLLTPLHDVRKQLKARWKIYWEMQKTQMKIMCSSKLTGYGAGHINLDGEDSFRLSECDACRT